MYNDDEIIMNNPDCKGKLYTQRELNKKLRELRSKERKFTLKAIFIASVLGLGLGVGGKALHDWHHDNKVDKANIEVDEHFEDFRYSLTSEQQEKLDAVNYNIELKNGKNAMLFRVKVLTCELCGYDYDKADHILYTSHYNKDKKMYEGSRSNPDGTITKYDEMSETELELAMLATGISNVESINELRELNIRFGEVINDVAREVYKKIDHINSHSMN